MQTISLKYESTILPDGHLSLPEDKAKALKLKRGDKISVILMKGKGVVNECFRMWAGRRDLRLKR